MRKKDGASSDDSKRKGKVWAGVIGLFVILGYVFLQVIPAIDANLNFIDRVKSCLGRNTATKSVKHANPVSDSPSTNQNSGDAEVPRTVRITNGVALDYVREELGPSARVLACGSNRQLRSHFYRFTDRYIQLIFSSDESLTAYAVTAADPSVVIEMPVLGGPLGASSYQELVPEFGDSVLLHHAMSSKAFYYTERHWLGNPGKYRSIYIGFNGQGVDLTPGGTLVSNPDSLDDLASARLNHPNTFGMSPQYMGAEEEDPFFQCGLGQDPIDLELPVSAVKASFDPVSFY